MAILKKLNVYSSNDVKANLDENLFVVFQGLGYKEDFKIGDVKLILSILCALTAAGQFYLDKKTDFNETFYFTCSLIAVYFSLSGALWVWTKFVEKNIKFVGHNNSNEKVVVHTRVEKTEPIYYVELEAEGSKSKFEVEFAKVYNENGFLVFEEFKSIFKSELEKLNKKST